MSETKALTNIEQTVKLKVKLNSQIRIIIMLVNKIKRTQQNTRTK